MRDGPPPPLAAVLATLGEDDVRIVLRAIRALCEAQSPGDKLFTDLLEEAPPERPDAP